MIAFRLKLAVLAATVIPPLFLFSPRISPEMEQANCVTVMEFVRVIHITINCDSHVFLPIAENPRLLFMDEYKVRQSRPVYSFLGWVSSKPIKLLLNLFGIGRSKFVSEYIAFLAINWVLLFISVALFLSLVEANRENIASVILPITALCSNQITKAYFWTPHLQIFNILTPIFSVLLLCWMRSRHNLSLRYYVVAGAVAGIGMLAYGSFAILAGSVALCILCGSHKWGFIALQKPSQRIVNSLILLSSFFAPILLWILLVYFKTGTFYAHETAKYRQFVWLLDLRHLEMNEAMLLIMRNLTSFFSTLVSVLILPGLIFLFLSLIEIAMLRWKGVRLKSLPADKVNAILFYLIAAVPFYAFMGFYETRLSWSFVPIVLLVLAFKIMRLEACLAGSYKIAFKAFILTCSALYLAFWVLRSGPYS